MKRMSLMALAVCFGTAACGPRQPSDMQTSEDALQPRIAGDTIDAKLVGSWLYQAETPETAGYSYSLTLRPSGAWSSKTLSSYGSCKQTEERQGSWNVSLVDKPSNLTLTSDGRGKDTKECSDASQNKTDTEMRAQTLTLIASFDGDELILLSRGSTTEMRLVRQ